MSGSQERTRAVVTVLGAIAAEAVGPFLVHEHLLSDLASAWYAPPTTDIGRAMAQGPLELRNLWWLRENPYAREDNLQLDDLDMQVEELMGFAGLGGFAIVECSVRGIRPRPEQLRWLSQRSGVHIIAGTGYYTAKTHGPEVDGMSVERIADGFVQDLTEHFTDSEASAGFIGELGIGGLDPVIGVRSTSEIHPNERKVLLAAARAHRLTGAAIVVHPPRSADRLVPRSRLALELLDLLEGNGVDPRKVVLCHLDSSAYEDWRVHREIARRGAYVEYDAWGWNDYFALHRGDGFFNDLTRLQYLKRLIDAGFVDHVLLSQDIAAKYRLQRYGGHGYSYLLRFGLPMMVAFGIPEDAVRRMLVENPVRLLARPVSAAVLPHEPMRRPSDGLNSAR